MLFKMMVAGLFGGQFPVGGENPAEIGSLRWWIFGGISIFLVCFAGIMSGLTLGLMSLGVMDLEVLQRSGTDLEKKQANAIAPVVEKQHQLLVTLLLCNACAMEALPIFLDKMFNEWVAVMLSVTFVLAFGEVIPQAICSRFGLAVGANLVWLVKLLMYACWPIAYPIGLTLDYLLGHDDSALFRRAQLKALVSIHGKEAGGYLTLDETTIISGALDLTEKIAKGAMTPIESTFSLDVCSKLDWEALGRILARGHSRVPVYAGSPRNIVGLLLVKSLLTIRAEDETPVSAVSIRRIPRVPEDMPLYDILNEFQKGGSHMAAVVKVKSNKRKFTKRASFGAHKEERKGFKEYHIAEVDTKKLSKSPRAKMNGESSYNPIEEKPNSEMGRHDNGADGLDEVDVIGIITMEDIMEELLQEFDLVNLRITLMTEFFLIGVDKALHVKPSNKFEEEEIVDETDEYIDVHKRIRVAAAAAQVGRSTSVGRRASIPNIHMGLSRQAQEAVQKGRVDSITSQMSGDVIAEANKKGEKGLNEKGLNEPLL